MKQLFFIIAIAATLTGCAGYTQIVSVSADNNLQKTEDKFYEFKNEDLIVRYCFWAEAGVMGFLIYNNTDKPVYIDWKKSSIINSGKNIPYYTNKTTSNYITYGEKYGTAWAYAFNGIAIGSAHSAAITIGAGTSVKEERITFLPPHSYKCNAFYNLTANLYFDINARHTEEEKMKGTKVFVSTSNNVISFRNYITYSHNEDFTAEKHVDNDFRIGKIYTVKSGQINLDEWYKPSRFYITNLEEIFERQAL